MGHRPTSDVVTRWNSTVAMLERLCEQTPAILSLVGDPNLTKDANTTMRNWAFTFEEQAVVEVLIKLLKPFEIATKILCAEQSQTVQKVLPVVTELKILELKDDDPTLIKILKMKMKQELNEMSGSEDIAIVACVLSPYTKDFDFTTELKTKAHSILRNLALENKMPAAVKIKVEKTDNSFISEDLQVFQVFHH